MDPLPGGRLRHDVDVDLHGSYTEQLVSVAPQEHRGFVLGRGRYLLPGQRDHVQGTVHKASHHHLVPILSKHGIVHPVVGRHILKDEGRDIR